MDSARYKVNPLTSPHTHGVKGQMEGWRVMNKKHNKQTFKLTKWGETDEKNMGEEGRNSN